MKRWLITGVCLLFAGVGQSALAADANDPARLGETIRGKVVPLSSLQEKSTQPSNERAGGLALLGDDGQTYLIVRTDGSQPLFKDDQLLNRAVQLTVARFLGSKFLVVKEVRTIVKGQLLDVTYWCNHCVLRYSEPGKCICCGADVERLEVLPNDEKLKSPALYPAP